MHGTAVATGVEMADMTAFADGDTVAGARMLAYPAAMATANGTQ